MTYNISKPCIDFLPPFLSKQLPSICELRGLIYLNPYSSSKDMQGPREQNPWMKHGSPRTKVSPGITHCTHVPHTLRGSTNQLSLPPPSDTLLQHSCLTLWPAHLDLVFAKTSCSQLCHGLEVLHGGTCAGVGRSQQLFESLPQKTHLPYLL